MIVSDLDHHEPFDLISETETRERIITEIIHSPWASFYAPDQCIEIAEKVTKFVLQDN